MSSVFEGTWVFPGTGKPSCPNPTAISPRTSAGSTVLVTRDADGITRVLLQHSCMAPGHAGVPEQAMVPSGFHVCRLPQLVLRQSAGTAATSTFEKQGAYGSEFSKLDHGLVRVARFESYRATCCLHSANADVPPLEDHLGDAKVFLDLIIDQSPTAQLELVLAAPPTTSKVTGNCNTRTDWTCTHLPGWCTAPTWTSDGNASRAYGACGNPTPGPRWPGCTGLSSTSSAATPCTGRSRISKPAWGRPISYDPANLDYTAREGRRERWSKWMLRARNLTDHSIPTCRSSTSSRCSFEPGGRCRRGAPR